MLEACVDDMFLMTKSPFNLLWFAVGNHACVCKNDFDNKIDNRHTNRQNDITDTLQNINFMQIGTLH